ncbi:DUF4152 domain-containing protein [Candidatus Bathyarchaeota archaeon]|nr:DUF4152 domain-containing protein [Candidatus Bathyarchaeota archaeon]
MKIVSADSSVAILDSEFVPQYLVGSASVLVESPYREARSRLAKPIFKEVKDGYEVIVGEAELCRDLLSIVKADVVHLDLSLGAVPVEDLSPVQLSNMRVSAKARQSLLRLLPRLRKVASEIKRVYGLDMLAIGKESIPVRVAELTAAAEAVLFACGEALAENEEMLLGLPSKCQPRVAGTRFYLHSLMAAEHDVCGYVEDFKGILSKVNIVETLNPCARGFRALRVRPKHQV